MKTEAIVIAILTLFATSFESNDRVREKGIVAIGNTSDVSCSVVKINANTYSFKYVLDAGLKMDSIRYFSEVKPSSCLDYENVLRIKKSFQSKFGYEPSKLMVISNVYNHSSSLSKDGIGLVHIRNENFSVTHGCSFKALIARDTVYLNFENENVRAFKNVMLDFRNKYSSTFPNRIWKRIEEDFIRGKECY
jgi:predicted ATP-grasp superfamily ATP-dependent carboligase